MGKQRFVSDRTVRLPLSEGDWIDVKEQIGYGERATVTSAAFARWEPDGEARIDYNGMEIVRIFTWVVDWSFRDAQDKPVPVSKTAIANLDPATGDEIKAALDLYVESVWAEKKATPTETTESEPSS